MMCLLCQTTTADCVSKPGTAYVSDILCNKATHYCTVLHQVYANSPTTVFSYQRACNPIGSQKYGLTKETQFWTWICHCSSDYCNNNTAMGDREECHPPPDHPPPDDVSRADNMKMKLSLLILWLVVVAGHAN
jgi:hypothetical protein